MPKKKTRKKMRVGFAAMSPEKQREIARKGGEAVSKDSRHMARIGEVGGNNSWTTRAKKRRKKKGAK